MDIHDLMSNLGITPEGNETPATTPEQPAKNAQLARQDLAQTVTPAETTPVTPAQTPEPVASCAENDAPVAGKIYALTGGTNQPSIANGNTWAESEVREEQTPATLAPVPQVTPWQTLMELRPDGCMFKHGISRRGAPYAFWSGADRETHDLTAEAKRRWKACQGANVARVIDSAWRRFGAARRNGGLSHGAVTDLKDAYSNAGELDREEREQTAEAHTAPAEAPRENQPARQGLGQNAPEALQARAAELETAIARVEAIDVDDPDAGEQLAQVAQVATVPGGELETPPEQVADANRVALDAAFRSFRSTRDLGDAATLQKAMTAYIQAGE